MLKHYDKTGYLYPIGGGQQPAPSDIPPEQIETQNFAEVYDADSDTWSNWLLTAYRPTSEAAAINFSGGGIQTVVGANPGDLLCIVSIALTVDDETNITLYVNGAAISGPMDFGGDGEPRGIVIPFPFSPLDCGRGGNFQVGSSDAVQVSGTVSYILV